MERGYCSESPACPPAPVPPPRPRGLRRYLHLTPSPAFFHIFSLSSTFYSFLSFSLISFLPPFFSPFLPFFFFFPPAIGFPFLPIGKSKSSLGLRTSGNLNQELDGVYCIQFHPFLLSMILHLSHSSPQIRGLPFRKCPRFSFHCLD